MPPRDGTIIPLDGTIDFMQQWQQKFVTGPGS